MNDLDQYTDIIELLEQRAALLQPRQDLINSALQRCERYQTAHSEPSDAAVDEGAPTNLAQLTEPGQQTMQESRHEEQQIAEYRAVADRLKSKKRGKYLQAGTEIQGYRIMGMLGRGGMGQVYRALQISMNREVAFKVLSPRYAKSENFRKRFLREAHSAGRLHHRHLIAVHDVDETEDGILFFSMELVEGKSIADLIDENGRMDEAEALRLCRQTLDALSYAHDAGIIHRDIKPDNIMIDLEGVAKVADLGLSRIDDDNSEDAHVTAENTMMGTPYYMSPEQSRDAHNVDHRTDLYSLGATLFHMVCGDVPFDGETPLDVVVASSTEKLVYPHPSPSLGVRRLIESLMAKEPDKRPQDAAAAIAILDKLESDPKARLQSPRVSNILISAVIIILVILIIIILSAGEGAGENVGESTGKSTGKNTHNSNAPVREDPPATAILPTAQDVAHTDMAAPDSSSTLADQQPENLLQRFYYDRGDKPVVHGGEFIFKANGQGSCRVDELVDGTSSLNFVLELNDWQRALQEGTGRQYFSLQFLSPKSGQRSLSPMILLATSRGLVFGRSRKGLRALSETDIMPFDPREKDLSIIITVEGKEIFISVSGRGGNQVKAFPIPGVESVDVSWKFSQPVAVSLLAY